MRSAFLAVFLILLALVTAARTVVEADLPAAGWLLIAAALVVFGAKPNATEVGAHDSAELAGSGYDPASACMQRSGEDLRRVEREGAAERGDEVGRTMPCQSSQAARVSSVTR
jgi:hypothetical protein